MFPMMEQLVAPFMPHYVVEGEGGNPPALPEGFSLDALQGDAWVRLISEKFKDNPIALNTKSPLDALEQLTNAQKLVGTKRLPEPQEDWTQEQWDSFYKQLGRPEAPDKYEYALGDEFKGIEIDPEFKAVADKALHGLGLTSKQYKGAMDTFFTWLKGAMANDSAARENRYEESLNTLKKEFGGDFEPKVQMADQILNKFGDPEFSSYLKESGLGNDPRFIKFMFNIADQFKDDAALGDALTQNLSGVNMAKKEIADMKADDSFQKKLFDEMHPGHKDAVRRWHEAHKRAFPGAQSK